MPKIIRKTHFFEGRRTFLELNSEEAKLNERGYATEGKVSIKIGSEEGVKAVFKLSADEARAVRDAINQFLKSHDRGLVDLYSREGSNNYSNPEPPQVDFSQQSTSIFNSDPEPQTEPKKDPPEFYY